MCVKKLELSNMFNVLQAPATNNMHIYIHLTFVLLRYALHKNISIISYYWHVELMGISIELNLTHRSFWSNSEHRTVILKKSQIAWDSSRSRKKGQLGWNFYVSIECSEGYGIWWLINWNYCSFAFKEFEFLKRLNVSSAMRWLCQRNVH